MASTLALTTLPTMAADVAITARFQPDENNPDVNQFRNTTPNEGYCMALPSQCVGKFSVGFPNITANFSLPRGERLGFRVPRSWQDLQITHSDGSTRVLKFRVVAMGAIYRFRGTVTSSGARSHADLWEGGAFATAPSGCTSAGASEFTSEYYRFFWNFNSDSECFKVSRYNVPSMYVYGLNFMYELQTPDPLDMSVGNYTGSLNYTIGPNGDFKMGLIAPTDPIMNLNFTLTVHHALRVQFPVNSNLLSLQPQGGWQQWVTNGSNYTPPKLMMNQPFQQWASTRFKMQVQCQYNVGDDCGIQNSAGDTLVPVKTFVTFPMGIRDASKRAVNKHPLSNTTASIFTPTRYESNARSTMHFEVDKNGVDAMIKSGGGGFRGDVTIIWDGDI